MRASDSVSVVIHASHGDPEFALEQPSLNDSVHECYVVYRLLKASNGDVWFSARRWCQGYGGFSVL